MLMPDRGSFAARRPCQDEDRIERDGYFVGTGQANQDGHFRKPRILEPPWNGNAYSESQNAPDFSRLSSHAAANAKMWGRVIEKMQGTACFETLGGIRAALSGLLDMLSGIRPGTPGPP